VFELLPRGLDAADAPAQRRLTQDERNFGAAGRVEDCVPLQSDLDLTIQLVLVGGRVRCGPHPADVRLDLEDARHDLR
jgi:hypothetical protein